MKIALRTKFFYVLMCASLIAVLAIGAQPLTSAKAAGPEACNVTTTIFTIAPAASTYKTLPDPAFTVRVQGAPGLITGTVMFYDDPDGAGALPAVAVSGAIPVAQNVPGIFEASTTLAGLTVNGGVAHNIFAIYSGDANYCTSTSAAALHTVAPVVLTVGGAPIVNPATRVYDRTDTVTFSGGTLVGVIAPDVVTLATQVGTTTGDAFGRVGVAKPVTPAFTLGGADAGNYVLIQPAGPFTITITQKPLNVTGITASNKVYDATPAATIQTGGAVFEAGGVILGDAVNLVGVGLTGTFTAGAPACVADKNVGTGKIVCIAGYTLGGADQGNYSLTQPTATADITPALITLNDPDGAGPLPADGGVVINPRAYDTTNVVSTWAAASWPLGVADGVLLADVVTIVPGSGTYDDANAGVAKPVVGTGFTLGGADGGNYTLFAQPVGLKGDITIAVTALCLKNPGPWTYNGSPWFANLQARLGTCGGVDVPGTFSSITYSGSGTAPTNVGVYAVAAAFTSDAPLNYPNVTAANPPLPVPIGNITINQYNPFLYVSNSPVAYDGLQHAAIPMAEMWNGTEWVNVPGTFTDVRYNGSATLPSAVGTYSVTGLFTPADAVNYATAPYGYIDDFVIGTGATLSVTNSPVVYNGVAQAAVVVGSVPGTVWNVRYDGGDTVPTDAGTYAVTADFVPNDPSYITLYDAPAGNFVINKATPAAPVLAVTGSPVTYDGSAHSAGVTVVSAAVPGSVANILTGGALTQTAIGTYAVTVDFVPFNTNYTTLAGLSAGNFVIAPMLPVELVVNGGFNLYTGTSMIPDNWDATRFAAKDGKSTTRKEGLKSVRIEGNGKRKTLTQEILSSGAAGTTLNFKFWVKGLNIPSGGACSALVKLYNGSTLVQTRTVACPTGTYSWTSKAKSFNAFGDYTKVVIKITYLKASGYVWFDGVSLLK